MGYELGNELGHGLGNELDAELLYENAQKDWTVQQSVMNLGSTLYNACTKYNL